MRLSRGFIPTLKETPNEAQIASHRLMLRAGLVRQTSAGIYAWLPLGLRVLRNIERIVREEQDASGGAGNPDADHPVRPSCGAKAAATTITARRCCASATATSATCCTGRPMRR